MVPAADVADMGETLRDGDVDATDETTVPAPVPRRGASRRISSSIGIKLCWALAASLVRMMLRSRWRRFWNHTWTWGKNIGRSSSEGRECERNDEWRLLGVMRREAKNNHAAVGVGKDG